MFLLFLQLCFSANTTEEDDVGTNIFAIYAGRLIYHNDTDGSCIACNGTCDEAHAVGPHSWTATLKYEKAGKVMYGTLDMCNEYALKVTDYVVGYTWTESSHNCSLHVQGKKQNIAEEMMIYNGFTWEEENRVNNGPLFLSRLDDDPQSLDARCYYMVVIKGPSNMAREMYTLIIGTVVLVMITWNGWMRYTKNCPRSQTRSPTRSPKIEPTDPRNDRKLPDTIYIDDSSDKPETCCKKDE